MAARRLRQSLAVALLALAAACASGPKPIDLARLSIQAQPDANQGGAVAVDVVLLYDLTVQGDLLKLPAQEWFRKRAQIQRDHPDDIAVRSWELVPGQSVDAVTVDRKTSPLAAVVYANYATPGDHRLRIAAEDGSVGILLQASDVAIQPATRP